MKSARFDLRKVAAGVASTLYGVLLLSAAVPQAAMASDTEVYTKITPAAGEAAPSMMFMLDTSGSMGSAISSSDSTTRMSALKSAMETLLLGGTVNGTYYAAIPGTIKVGLSRYYQKPGDGSQYYGRVAYPARPLDALVDLDVNSQDSQIIDSGSDDAEQNGATQTLGNTTLGLAYSGASSQSVGLRFTDVDVPKGAKIIEAKIVFTSSENTSIAAGGLPQWSVQVEDVDDAATYSTSSTVNSRSYNSKQLISYITDPWTLNSEYETDVTDLMQLISDRSGWCGGNAVAFRVQDVGAVAAYRKPFSFEGSSTKAPRLVVYYTYGSSDPGYANSCVTFERTYQVSSSNDDAQVYGTSTSLQTNNSAGLQPWQESGSPASRRRIGVRFASTSLKLASSSVVKATLVMRGRTAGTGLNGLTIKGYDSNSVGNFASSIPASPLTTASSTWTPPSGAVAADVDYAMDVTAPVAAVVGRSGFLDTNALGLNIESVAAGSSAAAFQSYDSNSAYSPRLTVKLKVTNLNNLTTVRSQLNKYIKALAASGNTPLGMSMLESAAYMLGDNVYQSASSADSMTSDKKKYISPIGTEVCVDNRLLILTDGEPTSDNYLSSAAKATVLDTSGCDTSKSGLGYYDVLDTNNRTTWMCMYQMADVLKTPSNTKNTVSKKIITSTMVVGQDLDSNQEHDLEEVSKKGGGSYYSVSSPQTLLEGIKKELDALNNQSSSVAAPGVAVNQFSRLNHLDQLYYAVFDPADSAAAFWPGNMKRYKLAFDASGNAMVADKDGVDAVDPTTSFFKSTAWSYWSTAKDGNNAVTGGAASKLPTPASRNMFTYTSTYGATKPYTLTKVVPSTASFRTAAQPVLGTANDTTTQNLLNWLLGYDFTDIYSGLVTPNATTPLRQQIGGVLHSRPVLVNYSYTGDADLAADCPEGSASGGTCTDSNSQTNYVFFSSMEGVLHAINTRTGVEAFSFVPKETLGKVKSLYDNPALSLPEFGLDGSWTVYRNDKDADYRITTGGSGDAVWLYGGMRMGGNTLYAVDATDITTPKLKWVINSSTSTEFARLGQTWSQPALAKVKVNGTLKTVLIFGGGYDSKHEDEAFITGTDDGTTRGANNDYYGNQVYIVDADTGDLIAWASASGATANNSNMKFSIPSEVKVLDLDRDGLAETLYVGDLGGQVFRIDLDNGNSAASGLINRVYRVAALGVTQSATPGNRRRFYEPPSVALMKDGANIYAAVAISSGYRSHPLNEQTNDFFYVIRDYDVTKPGLLTMAGTDLAATAVQADFPQLDLSSLNGVAATSISAGRGWSIDLPDVGEKGLASPLIFRNEVLFTSYVPATTSACSIVAGSTKLYRMSVVDGKVVTDFNANGTITASDRVMTDVVKGLGSEPQIVVLKGGKSAVVVGTKAIGYGSLGSPTLKRTRWYQKYKN